MKSGDYRRPVVDGVVRQIGREKKTVLTRFLFVCLAVILVSGCGRYKQDLEDAKARIDKLTADNKNCTEISASLEKDKQRLSEERQALDAKMDIQVKQLSELKMTNKALTDELGKLKKSNRELSEEVKTLNKEKSDLSKKLDELKSRTTELPKPGQPPAMGPRETTPVKGTEATVPKAPEKMSPCDAIIAFMKASEKAIREQKGQKRSELLKRIKEEYGPRIQDAPKKAVTNAEAWVEEAARSWDKPGDDFVFNLLTKRNAVLNACGKDPKKSGF